MKPSPTSCTMRISDIHRGLKSHMRQFDHCMLSTPEMHLYTILNFLEAVQRDHLNPPGRLVLSEERVMEWLSRRALIGTIGTIMQRVHYIARFLRHLSDLGTLNPNPMAMIEERFGKRGWAGIVRALRQPDPGPALDALRPEPPYSGSFGKLARSYVAVHRAAGKKFSVPQGILVQFNAFLRHRASDSIGAVSPELVQQWTQMKPCSQHNLRRRLLVVRRFFDYALACGASTANPVTPQLLDYVGVPKSSFKPFIFTQAQVVALLAAAKRLPPTPSFPLRAETMSTILSLLYTLGLRISEAVHLQIGDIDFEQRTIFLRQTKFYKERYVPFGPRLERCLKGFLAARRTIRPTEAKTDLLFMRWAHRPVTAYLVERHFRQSLHDAGVAPEAGRPRPRLHDLRHTFAVHRLLRWYREGGDVQSRLVLLATFMGHISVRSTQVYLTITDSLLQEANGRFHVAFGSIAGERSQ
jgi:integrase/recombinase XerD